MGKRGRKPTPTWLKRLNGNPGKRRLCDNEIQPPSLPAVPEPPVTLCEVGHRYWGHYAPLLHSTGLLTAIDVPALERLCESEAAYRRAFERFGKKRTLRNQRVKNGELQNLMGLYARFGLTPTDRMRLSPSAPAAKKSGLVEFARLKGRA